MGSDMGSNDPEGIEIFDNNTIHCSFNQNYDLFIITTDREEKKT